jgi:cell wall-associated NlpC family hydrolase
MLTTNTTILASEPSMEYGDKTAVTRQTDAPSSRMSALFSDVRQYFGIRYRFGGTTPAGFDCSGFVQFMFSKVFNMQLPRSSKEMSALGIKVGRSELKPGDLVFFRNGRNRINHVGIFIGNNTFIHSSLSRGITRTSLSENYFDKRFATGVRILDFMDDKASQAFENIGDYSNPS